MDKSAYELADELQELDSKLHLINLFKSANMLRQQANRIAELEKSLSEAVDSAMWGARGGGVDWYAFAKHWNEKL